MAKFKSGDTGSIGEFYTEDGWIMPPNSASIAGKAGVRAFWQSLWDSGIGKIKLHEGDVQGCGDMAVEVLTVELLDIDGQTVDRGKYIVIWKLENSEWRLHRDIT